MALITGKVSRIFEKLVNCLRKQYKDDVNSLSLKCFGPVEDAKGVPVKYEPRANKEASEAYKKLMEYTEDELFKHFRPGSWLLQLAVAIALGFLMVAANVIVKLRKHVHQWRDNPMRLLNVRLDGWAWLLFLVVSSKLSVQFNTLVLSEPFVWIYRTSKYTFYFARKMKSSVDVTLWFAFMLWVWYTWFVPRIIQDVQGAKLLHANVEEYNKVLNKVVKEITTVLTAIAIGAALWTVKQAIYLKLRSDLHFKVLCDRLCRTIIYFTAIHYIEKNRSRRRRQMAGSTENNNNAVDAGRTIDIDIKIGPEEEEEKWGLPNWEILSKIRKKTVPIWIVKELIDKYLNCYDWKMAEIATTTTMMGSSEAQPNDEHKLFYYLEDTYDDEKLMDEVNEMLYDVMDGKKEDHVDINMKMLEDFGLKEEEIKVFKWLASRKDGKPVESITQDQFVRWALKAVMNCKELRRTIESSKSLFSKLHWLMSSSVVVLTIVIWLMLTDIVNTGQIAILFTPFLSMIFTSSNSLKKVFDGIMFVFALHPFDVGDRIIIDRVEMKVIELEILKSKFIRYDTGKETSYPNSELCTKSIINLEVDPEEFDSIDFPIAVDTPQELVCDLQIKIKKTLDDNITFTSDTIVTKRQISDKKMMMTIYFKYFISPETKGQHRSKVLCKVVKLRKEMNDQMRLQREEIKAAKRRPSSIPPPEAIGVGFLRFEINAKLKLSRIQVLQDKITSAIKGNSRFRGCSKPLFRRMNKEIITMDVQVKYPKRDFDKHQLLEYMEKQLKNEDEINGDNYERMEKDVKVEWLPKADWEEDC